MNSISSNSQLIQGRTLAIVAVAALAITVIALAVIFAPPFFLTAPLAGCAVYLAVGGGVTTVITSLGAFQLLKKKEIAHEISDDEEEVDWLPAMIHIEKRLGEGTNSYRAFLGIQSRIDDKFGSDDIFVINAKKKAVKVQYGTIEEIQEFYDSLWTLLRDNAPEKAQLQFRPFNCSDVFRFLGFYV